MTVKAQEDSSMPQAQTAATWYARIHLGAPSAEDRQAFDEWLARDALHGQKYAEYDKLWGKLSPLGADPRIAHMRRELLTTVNTQRVYRAHWRGAAIAAAVVLSVLAMVMMGLKAFPSSALQAWLPPWLGGTETFVTSVGQRATVPLEDGSTVVLNTASEIEPHYTATERAIHLTRGQALFEVARDATRPFVVYAADQRIVALGTAFDVRLEDTRVRITLVEGRVAVNARARPDAAPATELSPGQQFIAARGAQAEVRQADIAAVTSWRNGYLVFSDDRLADAVAEVNRYSHTQIVLADPALAALRVSGVFRTGQTAGFVAALESRFPLEISERQAHRIVLRSR